MTETPTEAFSRQNVGERMFAGLGVPPRVVVLPWPDRKLHPNARCHWRAKAPVVKKARADAAWLTWAHVGRNLKWPGARVSVTFNPPDNRRRDIDGMIASHKAAQDGIADALGIDDSKFQLSYAIGTPIKGGSVRVEILPI